MYGLTQKKPIKHDHEKGLFTQALKNKSKFSIHLTPPHCSSSSSSYSISASSASFNGTVASSISDPGSSFPGSLINGRPLGPFSSLPSVSGVMANLYVWWVV
ncbi:hypothetical protein EMIT093MI4_170003 [Pseudomonas sp. IT-93MI4]